MSQHVSRVSHEELIETETFQSQKVGIFIWGFHIYVIGIYGC